MIKIWRFFINKNVEQLLFLLVSNITYILQLKHLKVLPLCMLHDITFDIFL